jgi:2-polyprenyl-3-methyl-5-hydroxy-6-metoxy-1,4-benzoquinol methylase
VSHPDIDPGRADRLRQALGLPHDHPQDDRQAEDEADATAADADPADEPAPPPAPPSPGGGPKAAVKRALRPAIDRAQTFVRHHATQVTDEALAAQRERADHLEAQLAVLRAEMSALVPAAGALAAVADSAALIQEGAKAAEEARATRINSELMKAELAEVHRTLEELGRAISPDAGLEAAPERLAELRDRVDAIDRRVRRLAEAPTTAPTGEAPPASPQPAGAGDGFDYVGFERRFRGETSTVLGALVERYADRLAGHAPVLDVGCGRGELLAALAERGVEGRGVDLDPEMADEARARGVDVTVADAVQHLETLADGALGSIVAIHLVEHLPLATLTRFLELAARKVRPGGIAIFETPNPTSLIVLGNSYILDPTHQWPLHPSLLAFMCERAGFRDIELQWWSPASDYHLPLIEGVEDPWAATVNEAFEKLNHVLFGPQEYAIIATTPPG